MEKIYDFTLSGIANDFRFRFTNILSNLAVQNSWRSSISVKTNKEQNAFFFSQSIKYDSDRVVEGVYRDIQQTLKLMREYGFEFDVTTIKKGREIEVTNIKWSQE